MSASGQGGCIMNNCMGLEIVLDKKLSPCEMKEEYYLSDNELKIKRVFVGEELYNELKNKFSLVNAIKEEGLLND